MNKKPILILLLLLSTVVSACSRDDNAHTTAVIQIPPPPRQVLTVNSKPVPPANSSSLPLSVSADLTKPYLVFLLENGKSVRVGEEVPISFRVINAKLKGEGGEFRVRYIVDDDEMKWLDTAGSFWLAGWTPGKHTLRFELIGPDGWPYKNGDGTIITKEINVQK